MATPATAVASPGSALCDRGVCWEAPVPTNLGITAVAPAGPDDWWFGTTNGLVLHRDHGVWSMRFAGLTPTGLDETWYAISGVAVCGGTPWASIVDLTSSQTWMSFSGGAWSSQGRIVGLDGFNYAIVETTWSGAGGECAFGGSAMQGSDRPWLALGGATSPAPVWEQPETTAKRSVSAVGGTDVASLWLAVKGPGVAGLWQHQADGGFAKTYPLPSGLTGDLSGVCESPDGGLYVSGATGLARASADGGAMLSTVSGTTGLSCLGSSLVSAGASGLVTCALASDVCGPPTETGRSFTAQADRDGVVVAGTRSGRGARGDAGPPPRSPAASGPISRSCRWTSPGEAGPSATAWCCGARAQAGRRSSPTRASGSSARCSACRTAARWRPETAWRSR